MGPDEELPTISPPPSFAFLGPDFYVAAQQIAVIHSEQIVSITAICCSATEEICDSSLGETYPP